MASAHVVYLSLKHPTADVLDLSVFIGVALQSKFLTSINEC